MEYKLNTKHQNIEYGIFVLPLGELQGFFVFKETNATIFACICSSPLVGDINWVQYYVFIVLIE